MAYMPPTPPIREPIEVNRDFYAEGADAAIAGQPGTLPADVREFGSDAEEQWIGGYETTLAGLGAVE
jgi:hypothetical protein